MLECHGTIKTVCSQEYRVKRKKISETVNKRKMLTMLGYNNIINIWMGLSRLNRCIFLGDAEGVMCPDLAEQQVHG